MTNKLQRAWENAIERRLTQRKIHGLLGRRNADGTYTFEVDGRPGFVHVTIRLSSGAQTVVPAYNAAGVEHAPNLAVEMEKENGKFVIKSRSNREDLAKVKPTPASGVPSHNHNQHYLKTEHISSSDGAADAGKPVVLDANGTFDPSLFIDQAPEQVTLETANRIPLSDTGVLKWFSYQTIRDAIKSYYDSVVATLTNKIIDGLSNTITNIGTSSLTDDAVSNAKLANMAEATVKGRAVGAGTGDPTDLTAAQLQAILETLAAYIRADGTRPLTANWDAGAFSILASGFQARTSGNLNLRSQDGLVRWQVDANGDLIGYADIGGGSVNDHFYQTIKQPASVTRLQTITIELVSVAAVLVWNTYFDIGLARNGNTAVFGWATGRITWQNPNSALAANILSSDLASNSSGTTTVTVTAITNGIRIAFGGGDFLNTLDRNSVIVRTLGYDALRPAVTINIA